MKTKEHTPPRPRYQSIFDLPDVALTLLVQQWPQTTFSVNLYHDYSWTFAVIRYLQNLRSF